MVSFSCPLEDMFLLVSFHFQVFNSYYEKLLRGTRKKPLIVHSNRISKPRLTSLSLYLSRTKISQAEHHDLYWALGDGGPQFDREGHGQRTDVLFGKVVRISVPSRGSGYEVPSGNYPGAGKE